MSHNKRNEPQRVCVSGGGGGRGGGGEGAGVAGVAGKGRGEYCVSAGMRACLYVRSICSTAGRRDYNPRSFDFLQFLLRENPLITCPVCENDSAH